MEVVQGQSASQTAPVPVPVPPVDGRTSALPSPTPAGPPRIQPRMIDPKTAFSTADKMKQYLREVPVLHARLVKAVDGLERTLTEARGTLAELTAATERVKTLVEEWEKEHGRKDDGQATAAPSVQGS